MLFGIFKRRKKAEQPSVVLIKMVADILTERQKPLDYKLAKGVRDELARLIVLALAKKNL